MSRQAFGQWCGLAAAACWASAAPGAAAAQQFVAFDATYTATADNTSDSHYHVDPGPDSPDNWRSPVDYASGSAQVRLEVIEKPSDRKTLYNICYEGMPSYACMPYSPPYTAPGVYEFSSPFSAFYQYDQVDWSKPLNKIALILKDENQNKPQGDPNFYPTKIHVTISIVAPGATYVPPATDADAGSDAGPAIDAGAPIDAGGGSARDAGRNMDAGTSPAPGVMHDAGAPHTARPMTPVPASTAGSGAEASPVTTGSGGVASSAPPAAAAEPAPAASGGCSATHPRSNDAGLRWLLLAAALPFIRRALQRRRSSRGEIDG